MSCFVVKHESIDVIATELISRGYNMPFHELRELNAKGKDLQSELDAMPKRLLAMNLKAVYGRYTVLNKQHKAEIKAKLEGYSYNSRTELNRWQLLKTMQCFLYQCAEDNIPKSKFYKKVKSVCGLLENELIRTIPQYENAKWD